MSRVKNERMWDSVIPESIVIQGRSPHRSFPRGEDLVLNRVPGTKYALYKIEYKRSKLFPVTTGKAVYSSSKKQ